MTHLDDDHLSAFFQAGDAGTYDGGPTQSLPPTAYEDLEAAEGTRGPTPQQIVRRERYTRLVTRLVGALAVVSVLGFAFRAARSGNDDAVATNAVAAAPVAVAPAAVPVAVPHVVDEPVPSSVLAVAAEPVAAPEPVPAVVEPKAAPAAEAAPVASPKVEPAVAAHTATPAVAAPSASHPAPVMREATSRKTAAPDHDVFAVPAALKTVTVSPAAPARPALVTVGAAAAKSGHTPPTASFD